jgi:CheY-like chemotaxis protein
MPSPVAPAEIFTVAFEGFSDFERTAIASFFRLTESRTRAYRQSEDHVNSDFLVADADHAAALDAVLRGRRIRETVFVGARVPHAALAWLPRPIDPMQIVRELDSLVELRRAPQQTDFDFPSVPGTDSAGMALQLPEVDTSFYNTEAAALSPPELDEPRPAPRAESHAPALAPTAPLEPAPSTRGDAPREVLVVEDSAIARKFLARRLQLMGYRVHTAASGEEALSQIAQHSFAIVFLDVVLGPPGSIDGLQLCQTLRKKAANPLGERSAVVMVTGLAGPTDRVRGSLAGCHAYLTKPLIESDFIAALRQVDPHFEWRRSVPSSV